MAIPFIANRKTSRTMIAAEVFSTKPRLTSSDQRKICTGNPVAGAGKPPRGGERDDDPRRVRRAKAAASLVRPEEDLHRQHGGRFGEPARRGRDEGAHSDH